MGPECWYMLRRMKGMEWGCLRSKELEACLRNERRKRYEFGRESTS